MGVDRLVDPCPEAGGAGLVGLTPPAFTSSQTRGLWPCDPDRLSRSGVPFERMRRPASGSELASVFQSVSRSEFDPGPGCDSDTDSEKTCYEGSPTPRFSGQAKATASSRGRLQSGFLSPRARNPAPWAVPHLILLRSLRASALPGSHRRACSNWTAALLGNSTLRYSFPSSI